MEQLVAALITVTVVGVAVVTVQIHVEQRVSAAHLTLGRVLAFAVGNIFLLVFRMFAFFAAAFLGADAILFGPVVIVIQLVTALIAQAIVGIRIVARKIEVGQDVFFANTAHHRVLTFAVGNIFILVIRMFTLGRYVVALGAFTIGVVGMVMNRATLRTHTIFVLPVVVCKFGAGGHSPHDLRITLCRVDSLCRRLAGGSFSSYDRRNVRNLTIMSSRTAGRLENNVPKNVLRRVTRSTGPGNINLSCNVVITASCAATTLMTIVYNFGPIMHVFIFRMRMAMHSGHRNHGHDHHQNHD